MKEKILEALKLACGQTTTTTDITLNKWVDYLTPLITEESQIGAEIEKIKPILTTYDGNMNFVVAAEVKKIKESIPPVPANPPANPPIVNDEPLWFKTWKETQATKNAALEEKLTAFEKQKTREAMITEANSLISKKYKISEAEKALSDKSMEFELKTNQHETVDKLVEGWKTTFESLRSAAGFGAIEPADGNSGGGKKDKPILKDLVKNLQKEGKLPIPEKTT